MPRLRAGRAPDHRPACRRRAGRCREALGVMMKQPIAYLLSGPDNDSYMLGEETRKATAEERDFFSWRFVKDGEQHPATCPKCGRKIDPAYIDPDFRLSNKRLDFSSTYDGYTIVSNKFKAFCEGHEVKDIEFSVLPSQPRHYRFVAHNVLNIDTAGSRGLRFLYWCDICDKYAGVFGTANLRFEGVDSPITQGIFRSDLEFAQAHEQAPLIVVGVELTAAMKVAGLKGLCFEKVEYARRPQRPAGVRHRLASLCSPGA